MRLIFIIASFIDYLSIRLSKLAWDLIYFMFFKHTECSSIYYLLYLCHSCPSSPAIPDGKYWILAVRYSKWQTVCTYRCLHMQVQARYLHTYALVWLQLTCNLAPSISPTYIIYSESGNPSRSSSTTRLYSAIKTFTYLNDEHTHTHRPRIYGAASFTQHPPRRFQKTPKPMVRLLCARHLSFSLL